MPFRDFISKTLSCCKDAIGHSFAGTPFSGKHFLGASKSLVERLEPFLWRLSKNQIEELSEYELRRLGNMKNGVCTARERARAEALRRAAKHYGDREWRWREWCLRLRRSGALADGGPVGFFELWQEVAPGRLTEIADEDEARSRAEAAYLTHLQAIMHNRTGLSIARLSLPMPSAPDRPADSEAILRMLWLWVGYISYDEALSEKGAQAVRLFLKSVWPKYPGGRVTRSVLENWVEYAKDIRYERDAAACYGRRDWDPRRGH